MVVLFMIVCLGLSMGLATADMIDTEINTSLVVDDLSLTPVGFSEFINKINNDTENGAWVFQLRHGQPGGSSLNFEILLGDFDTFVNGQTTWQEGTGNPFVFTYNPGQDPSVEASAGDVVNTLAFNLPSDLEFNELWIGAYWDSRFDDDLMTVEHGFEQGPGLPTAGFVGNPPQSYHWQGFRVSHPDLIDENVGFTINGSLAWQSEEAVFADGWFYIIYAEQNFAIPEAHTIVSLMFGLALIGFLRRRRRY